jgi:hypothetical protein
VPDVSGGFYLSAISTPLLCGASAARGTSATGLPYRFANPSPERSEIPITASRYAGCRYALAALGAAFALLALAAAATATAPVKGGSYKGTLNGTRSYIKVTFKVSTNGKTVTGLKTTDLPFYCSGGGPAVPITACESPWG